MRDEISGPHARLSIEEIERLEAIQKAIISFYESKTKGDV